MFASHKIHWNLPRNTLVAGFMLVPDFNKFYELS